MGQKSRHERSLAKMRADLLADKEELTVALEKIDGELATLDKAEKGAAALAEEPPAEAAPPPDDSNE